MVRKLILTLREEYRIRIRKIKTKQDGFYIWNKRD